ncbi:AAA family ATPase [Paenibacillus sp. NPDC056579]|uniref:AAA family ATPase n=1 Tax=Paenibacillus sp. NPDC056579 TaxID=3345871 RepID=UPI0036D1E341
MPKMKLVLLDTDAYFIEMVTSYIRAADYSGTFTVSAFTTKEHGFAFIEHSNEPFILLVHESFMPLPERVYQREHGCMLIVSDLQVVADIVEYPIICKYQPLNQLMSVVISHYNEFTRSRILKGNRSSEVISIYSAAGGSGKTLTAMHLARELVLAGQRVFYITLEELPSASWIGSASNEESGHFSRMLFYGKSDRKLQSAKVERMKRKHSLLGFDYFPGNEEAAELAEMLESDTEALIGALQATGSYDYILLDLDSASHPRVRSALKLSDHIVWLVVDERVQWEKTRMRMRPAASGFSETERLGKVTLLVNKFHGSLSNNAHDLLVPIHGYLPYIPEWKTFSRMEGVLSRSAFSESLAALPWFQALTGEAEVQRHVVG